MRIKNHGDSMPKILYLDQSFLSRAFKGDKIFVDVTNHIKKLISMKLLVVPFSSVHEEETSQWQRSNDLGFFIQAMSGGNRFKTAYEIEHEQILRSFAKFIGNSTVQNQLKSINILEYNDNYLFGSAQFLDEIKMTRILKDGIVQKMIIASAGWRGSITSSAQDLQQEYRFSAYLYRDEYLKHLSNPLDSSIKAMVIVKMLLLMDDGIPDKQKIQKCIEYFMSVSFQETPYHWIKARMLVALKKLIRNGAYPKPERAEEALSGFYHDVTTHSHICSLC